MSLLLSVCLSFNFFSSSVIWASNFLNFFLISASFLNFWWSWIGLFLLLFRLYSEILGAIVLLNFGVPSFNLVKYPFPVHLLKSLTNHLSFRSHCHWWFHCSGFNHPSWLVFKRGWKQRLYNSTSLPLLSPTNIFSFCSLINCWAFWRCSILIGITLNFKPKSLLIHINNSICRQSRYSL